MRFSLRSLLFWTTLACLVIGWVQYHQIDYRWLWPPHWRDVLGGLFIVAGHRTRAELGLPLAKAGLLVLLANAIWAVHLPLYLSHSSDGILLGKEWFITVVRQFNAYSVIYPALALLVTGRLALCCRNVFTPWQQTLLTIPCVIGALQLLCLIYLVGRIARGV